MEKLKQPSVAVIGLGFVGLPLCELFLKNGFTVHGIDVDKAKLNDILLGNKANLDVDNKFLFTCMKNNRFSLFAAGEGVTEVDTIIICVPTPLTNENEPDLTYIKGAISSIIPHIKANQLICLESTTYPGTTEELILPKLTEKGFQVGKDIFLAYSPERINPGSDIPLSEIPKVVGGMTPNCLSKASDVYQCIFDTVVTVSSTRAAEITKLLENTQRFINISFMNDFAILCEKMDIDVYEVIDAASTKPYGFHRYTPSAGIGGHCIPIDPWYLSWKAKEFNHDTPLIKIADDINKAMPDYVCNKIKRSLSTDSKSPSKVLLIGIAYKQDVNDMRESPALPIMKNLQNAGIQVDYFDPLIPSVSIDSIEHVCVDERILSTSHYDTAVVLTEHSNVPYEKLFSSASTVLDARHLFNTSGTGISTKNERGNKK